MKFSEAWLREWVDPKIDTAALCHQLTMAGLEVDGVEARGDDQVIEIDLTPNRGDCLSVLGVAREVAALNDLSIKPLETPKNQIDSAESLKITLKEPLACPRYLGRVITGVNNQVSIPSEMRERLEAAGIAKTSPVVDITNYVMLMLGQPLHAFDYAAIEGDITVRFAKSGEKLMLLGEKEVDLLADTLVIADDQKALALGGVIGGFDSRVTEETTSIFLESAFFHPDVIAGRLRQYGLQTDAAHRFERGVDFDLPIMALECTSKLIHDICGGQCGPVCVAESESDLPERVPFRCDPNFANDFLGISVSADRFESSLKALGMSVTKQGDQFEVTAPSHRFDIKTKADLAEEIARMVGYDNLPVTCFLSAPAFDAEPNNEAHFKAVLAAMGFSETITYSFIAEPENALFTQDKPVLLANPISSDMLAMRTSLWPSLIQAMLYNVHRGAPNCRFFETGLTYAREGDDIKQMPRLAMLATGDADPLQWGQASSKLDFFDLKGDVENFLKTLGVQNVRFEPLTDHQALHPGQAASVFCGDQNLGTIGALHPKLAQHYGLKQAVFLADLDLSNLLEMPAKLFKSISKFPSVRRDFAFVVPQALQASALLLEARDCFKTWLVDEVIFDVYSGDHIDKGKKSIAFGVVLQHPERTLNDNEVNELVDRLIESVKIKYDATLRE
jgi:phenylalanyl-tRNA synthetase beta chain